MALYCRKCGAKLEDGARFCRACGEEVPEQFTQQEQENYGQYSQYGQYDQYRQPADDYSTMYAGGESFNDTQYQQDQQYQNDYQQSGYQQGGYGQPYGAPQDEPQGYYDNSGEMRQARSPIPIIVLVICMICATAVCLIFLLAAPRKTEDNSKKDKGGEITISQTQTTPTTTAQTEAPPADSEDDDDDEDSEAPAATNVKVPDLKGWDYNNAVGKYGDKLSFVKKSIYSDSVSKGIIIYNARVGETVAQGTTIEVTVSLGPKGGTTSAAVPNVIGKSYSEAEKAVKAAGYKVNKKEEYSNSVAKGKVISTDPKAGTALTAGKSVTITVSKGKKNTKVTIPSVEGADYNTAKSRLTKVGLKVKRKDVYDEAYDKGTATRTDPKEGTKVEAGSTVTIYVSKGSQYKFVTVPNVIGLSEEKATEKLLKLELDPDINYDYTVDKSKGVLSQDPSGGESVREGSAVTLTIAAGKAKIKTYTLPESQYLKNGNYRIMLFDANTYYEDDIDPNSDKPAYEVKTQNGFVMKNGEQTSNTDISFDIKVLGSAEYYVVIQNSSTKEFIVYGTITYYDGEFTDGGFNEDELAEIAD